MIVNVGELGGSGVFIPFRRIGEDKNAQFAAGGQIFGTRGPAEMTVTIDLDVEELRILRNNNREVGLSNSKKSKNSKYQQVLPSEHFLKTFDRCAGPPPIKHVETNELEWNSDSLLVAIAQLMSMPIEAYIESGYRLSGHPLIGQFEAGIIERLTALERQLARRKKEKGLSFIVFPEVFLPRNFVEKHIIPFVEKTRAIALCGVDYPGGSDQENLNSCLIVGPGGIKYSYDKVTRSQYDAIGQDGRKNLCRGDRLVRFQNLKGHAFGVLICYDFSHIDLVSRINLEDRAEPLDVLFILAHNSYSQLYRACCIADSHCFYQHIVMCNVSQYGGSGVFAPKRTNGARQVLLDIGVNTEAIALLELDLAGQRKARLLEDNELHSDEWMRKSGIFQRRFVMT